MKIVVSLCMLSVLFTACNKNQMASQYLTPTTVKREVPEAPKKETSEVSAQQDMTPVLQNNKPLVRKSQQPAIEDGVYHIIVASYTETEKGKAYKLATDLKTRLGYPASVIDLKGRYRVSIESFTNEKEAEVARDKYREETDRQDLWILKVE